MRKFTEKLVGKVLPKATGKAVVAKGACYAGCGGDGVWVDGRGRRSGERALCC